MKNYKKIKRMSLTEMAQFISEHTNCGKCPAIAIANCNKTSDCVMTLKTWLSQEVKNG